MFEEANDYRFSFAVIFPDKMWCFPESLSVAGIDNAEKVPIHEAIRIMYSKKPDVVMSHLYCRFGHTLYSGLVELLDFPLVGPNAEAALIGSNKIITRRMLQSAGVPVPPGTIHFRSEGNGLYRSNDKIGYPCVVKAACTEDSTGVFVVQKVDELNDALRMCFSKGEGVIVEKYIRGRELRTGVLEDENGNLTFLPVIEYNIKEGSIRTKADKFPRNEEGDVDLAVKHSNGQSWFLHASKDSLLLEKLKAASLAAFRALHCRSYALFDLRADQNGEPYFLEANLYCSYGPDSVVNVMAKHAGITGRDLLKIAVARALQDKQG